MAQVEAPVLNQEGFVMPDMKVEVTQAKDETLLD